MFSRFYQEELAFLREMGPEYARAHPGGIADALERPGADPDVERLLEGFAFMAARIRERLEDDFPEIVHSLLGLLWPHLLRPVPSACIATLTPTPGALREARTIAPGAEVQSVPVKGARCRFRTTQEVDLAPLAIVAARLQQENAMATRGGQTIGENAARASSADNDVVEGFRMRLHRLASRALNSRVSTSKLQWIEPRDHKLPVNSAAINGSAELMRR